MGAVSSKEGGGVKRGGVGGMGGRFAALVMVVPRGIAISGILANVPTEVNRIAGKIKGTTPLKRH
jgi:hypothetical protein